MEYFLLKQDMRIRSAIKISEISKDMDTDSEAIFINPKGEAEYIDYIEKPIPVIANKLKTMIEKYEPKLTLSPIVVTDFYRKVQQLYWKIEIPEIDCLSKETTYTWDGSLRKIVLDEEKIASRSIFKIGTQIKLQNYIVVNLNIAESILRRDVLGIVFEKIQKEKRKSKWQL